MTKHLYAPSANTTVTTAERTYVNMRHDVTTNHWPVCELFPVPCPNDWPKGGIPRNRLMEHIRSECKVKKDGKQLVEVKSQCDNLLEKLHHLPGADSGFCARGVKGQRFICVRGPYRDTPEYMKKNKKT